jgi:hypothetical protein
MSNHESDSHTFLYLGCPCGATDGRGLTLTRKALFGSDGGCRAAAECAGRFQSRIPTQIFLHSFHDCRYLFQSNTDQAPTLPNPLSFASLNCWLSPSRIHHLTSTEQAFPPAPSEGSARTQRKHSRCNCCSRRARPYITRLASHTAPSFDRVHAQ